MILVNFPRHLDLELSRSNMTKVVIATKRKSNLSIERQSWNLSDGIDFDADFNLEICYIKWKIASIATNENWMHRFNTSPQM